MTIKMVFTENFIKIVELLSFMLILLPSDNVLSLTSININWLMFWKLDDIFFLNKNIAVYKTVGKQQGLCDIKIIFN